ncbi:RagB/SusD family nutrient uptake outer membrane protein [Sphingobacterium sp.]|uniref:RagB/SusD family nutrient uptake outer membrane protein n=1 Tax=Sphingobacterium sp. TaxID=341027 RepID=UPI00289FC3EA|nr:RagB/SusD family nutrient uptake outer membrane protein [Sphingobacterium sp.]
MKKIAIRYMIFLLSMGVYGCNKILDEKSDKKLVVPTTLTDLQSILDNAQRNVFSDPSAGEVSTDDYYLLDKDYKALTIDADRRLYSWEPDYVFEEKSNSWSYGYAAIYGANTVLEGLKKMDRNAAGATLYDDIKGRALYLRAKTMLQLAALYAPAFDTETASVELGLPIRKSTDFNIPTARSSVLETYTMIVDDLNQAAELLPVTPKQVTRPSKPAAFGLLARTYLWMRQYDKAEVAATACLKLFNTLLDYSQINASASYPFTQFNAETITFSVIGLPAILSPDIAKISLALYQEYGEGDLRKELFFKRNTDGSVSFRGGYTGNQTPFGGISTNEIVLVKAETMVRNGKYTEGMEVLKDLLSKRWKIGYTDGALSQVKNPDDALLLILKERRKELLMRGLRWMDVKRLNKEGRGIYMRRLIDGKAYELSPNDKRYALAIPEDIITLTGIQQNPR